MLTTVSTTSVSKALPAESANDSSKVFNQARPYGGKVLTMMSFANRALSKVCQTVSKYAGNTVLGHKTTIKAQQLKLEMLEWTRDSALAKLAKGTEHAQVSQASQFSRNTLQTNLGQLSSQLLALGDAITRQKVDVESSKVEYQTFKTDRQTDKVSAEVAAMSDRIDNLWKPATQTVAIQGLSYSTLPFDANELASQQHQFRDQFAPATRPGSARVESTSLSSATQASGLFAVD